jgi:hypothetical protein
MQLSGGQLLARARPNESSMFGLGKNASKSGQYLFLFIVRLILIKIVIKSELITCNAIAVTVI